MEMTSPEKTNSAKGSGGGTGRRGAPRSGRMLVTANSFCNDRGAVGEKQSTSVVEGGAAAGTSGTARRRRRAFRWRGVTRGGRLRNGGER